MHAIAGYSVKQIKFEFLSYIKEFGGKGDDWIIGRANCLEDVMSGHEWAGLRQEAIWICKPALSGRAAQIVIDHMVTRHQVGTLAAGATMTDGNWIYLYRHSAGKTGDRL